MNRGLGGQVAPWNILDGHNARAGLVVQNMQPSAGSSSTGVQPGIQIQE